MQGGRVFVDGKGWERGRMRRLPTAALSTLVLLATALVLGNCTVAQLSGDDSSPRNPAPTNYKQEILAMLRVFLPDPTQVRDAAIAAPTLQTIENRNRYLVCVRLNAKKRDGQYAGVKEYVALFLGGRLDQLIDAKPEQCNAAEYQPFPEAQTLTR